MATYTKINIAPLFFQKHSLLKWRGNVITTLGWALLILHGIRSPLSINGFAFVIFLGILTVTAVTFVALVAAMDKFGLKGLDEKEAEAINERIFSMLKKKPWKFLLIPAEDGFFLLPLLYTGINPISAAVAAFLFAVTHYPSFPWRYCLPKGIAYFFVALFIVPYGIWTVVVAHLLVDVGTFTGTLLFKVEGKPTWRRLAKILGTE